MIRELERSKKEIEDRVPGTIDCTDDQWGRLTAGLGATGSRLWPEHVG